MRSRRTPATPDVALPEASSTVEMPSIGASNERAAAEMAVGGATPESSALDMAIATNSGGQAGHSGSEMLANTTTGRGQVGPYAVWTTGGGSSLLPRGNWGARDLRTHHSDRTASWAADRVREGRNIPYNSVDAYDLTFEKLDKNGNAVAGTALGLPLMTPVACKVYDVQHSFKGSGGYGKFVILEYMEGDLAGERVQVSHMHTVERIQKGQVLKGGQVFGTQGGSGSRGPSDYDVHVDIVGTAPAVILFTKANQSGTFQTESTGPVAGEGRTPPAVAGSGEDGACLLYTSPSPRDATLSRMPSSA